MNDEFLFAEEGDNDSSDIHANTLEPYHVLIVDDDDEIHAITRMALSEFKLDGHPVTFTSAHSGEEAKKILSERQDFAMTLLDVVMESDHAGLEVARWIREEMKNHLVRIVLRTGQPGQAPEEEVIAKYDIDDYKEKTELTYRKLVTLMYSCLRAYRDLCAIERNKRGLEKVIQASAEVFSARSLHNMCQGILEQIVALLTRSDDAAYCRTHKQSNKSTQLAGFTASADANHYEIIGGTGDYADSIGKDISDEINLKVVARLKSQGVGDFCLHDGHYYGLYSTSSGSEYLLFIRNIRELTELDKKLLTLFINNTAIAIETMSSTDAELGAQRELLYSVGEAIDKHSIEQRSYHVKRSAEMAAQLAILTGASQQQADQLKAAAAVYEVGKVSVQKELAESTDVLSVHKYEEIMQRVVDGHDYLKSSDSNIAAIAARLAQDFHERWDGTGFPSGKTSETIDLSARLLCLASHYDSIRSTRGHRRASDLDASMQYIKSHQGRIFDPELADTLLNHIDLFEKIRARCADNID